MASFSLSGNVPESIDWFMMRVIGWLISFMIIFSILVDRPSESHVSLDRRLSIIVSVVPSSIVLNSKLNGEGCFRKCLNEILLLLISEDSLVPMFVKKSLKLSAILLLSDTI